MNAVKVTGVSKTYQGVRVLTDINLEVATGTTIGIVGANGSGKSVLFKIICGFTAPDEGTVLVRDKQLGRDIDFPEDVGVLINAPGYIAIYSGFQNLKFLADIKRSIGNAEIKAAMQLVGLDPELKTKVANYSLGMKQKLGLAQAIMEGQDILVLDEPFNALDYQTYNDIKDAILRLKQEHKTLLLTSHNYEDLETLCDKVYIIQGGRLELLTEELKEKYFRRR
ncbi:ABC transporter ATP-binding protein [Paenibacillus donghaensis]|uniref:Multidrug ABC transporter ATP-binding protein n=1 Tax=Paenibacillus donghaensis TaxID=414771 RepID=A0A2Z2KKY1_9BACL|nr:ABC transporter ATP-binding protein [Paenibacillus donghaensis]ASA23973.1 multidrug ABC transporter ATP-binding protein [Paenibacillus donghaensis]